MALVLNDRVKETTTTTGTGTISLGGAQTNFETFVAGVGNSNTTYYAIVHRSNAEFEVGLGTITDASPDTLARTTIISSSNSDSAVNFSAGTKDVFCTLPASKAVHEDGSSDVTLPNDLILGSDSAVLKFGADSDTTLTHTDGTGLTLNSTNKLLFRDSALGINSSADGQLDLFADTEIQLAATTVDLNGDLDVSGDITIGDDLTVNGGVIDFKSNSGSPASLKMYCESSNAHFQTLQPQPHSASASNTLRLPNSGSSDTQDLVAVDITQTLTNKRLTSPKLNEDVAITATATEVNILDGVTSTTAELNILDGVTSTTAELNILDGVTSTAAELNILDGVTATATELNIMDGDTSASSTTLVDADRVVTNDAGTMKQVALSDVKTYLSSAGFSTDDPTALAIALG
jgi:hypothetical protein